MKITYEEIAQIVGGIYYGEDIEFDTVDDLIEFLETTDGCIFLFTDEHDNI